MSYDGSLMTGTTWSGDVTGSVGWTFNNNFVPASESVFGATGSGSVVFGYDNDLLTTCVSETTCSPQRQARCC